jgi:phage terminase small subunit
MSPSKRSPRPRCSTAQDNPRRDRFVQLYLKLGNATEAAKQAGYSAKTAYSQGARLLKDVEIQSQLQRLRNKVEERTIVTLEEVVQAIRDAAFLDPADIYDDKGNVKPLSKIPPAARRAIIGLRTTTFNLAGGDGVQETVADVRLVDKAKSFDMLMKHKGGYAPLEVKFPGMEEAVRRLHQGRARVAAAKGKG